MKIISGSNNPNLAKSIAKDMKMDLLHSKVKKFSNGEIKVEINGQLSKKVIIVQSTNNQANDNLIELMLIANSAKNAGAENIIAFIPYFFYSRQDEKKDASGNVVNLIIQMLKLSGIKKIITLDLHSEQINNKIDIDLINLSTENIFLPYINSENALIVSPDVGGATRALNYASLLNLELVIIDKNRDGYSSFINEVGKKIHGKNCIIIDDIIDTGTTILKATELLLQNGAKNIQAIVTHPVLSGNSIDQIEKSSIEKIYISDSIAKKTLPKKFITLSCSNFLKSRISR